MNWNRIDYAATVFLRYLNRLLVCAALASVVFLAWKAAPVLSELKATVHEVGSASKSAATLVSNTDRNLNAEPFGVLPEAKQTVKHVAATAKTLAETSLAERARFNSQADKLDKILDDADTLVLSAKGNLNTLTGDMGEVTKALTAAMGGIAPTVDELKQAIAAARVLLEDPEIKEAILNVELISKNVAGITGSIDDIAARADVKFGQMLNPSLKAKILGGLKTTVLFLYYLRAYLP